MLAEGCGPWGMGRENCTLTGNNSGGPRPLSSGRPQRICHPNLCPISPRSLGLGPSKDSDGEHPGASVVLQALCCGPYTKY